MACRQSLLLFDQGVNLLLELPVPMLSLWAEGCRARASDMEWNDTDAMRQDMEGNDNDMRWNDTMTQ